ncbi:Lrp/AsnC ligand binding domain-containing protein [Candidatus Nitrosotenuis chungbukensis]|uniref:Lrp/AsnC ligand binding domain-containing protein n=1 Tax=Candidatus Nitrosotenuis chungbukensis TaxID=1353246 RepID=UPI0005B284FB|nr:Lrp/AsnC ligand binding domain-containing protein [Candidatus Nitrosotenuis chungbukensis]
MSESGPTMFVLISCTDGETGKTIEHLQKISSVKEIRSTDGLYDIIIKVESKTDEEFKHMFNHKIRSLDSIKYTMTLEAIDSTTY